ncbi:AEC family transporter [Pectinatus haikarae]|uniref:Permease n=1 Tax=Pectinatus haikarae TaxID=349096 RepID=A0ABT9Y614_9FIRM|nr:AEC family transporter [Pectinatus haikarae]MDQ0203269.1 putative permease [Pectinatus haikarae]
MSVFLHAIEGVITLLLMGLSGWYMAYKGWIDKNNRALLPKLVNYISLPLFFVYNLTATFSKDQLEHLISGAAVPFLSMIICYFLSLLFIKFLNIRHGHRGTFSASFTNSNSIFVGVPVTVALFGEKALPYALLFFFANTTFFWTIGNASIQSDANKSASWKDYMTAATLKKIFSAPICGFLISVLLILADIKLPPFVLDTAKYLGNMTTPVALIFIGATLYSMNFSKLKFNRDLNGVLIGRFIAAPIITYIVGSFFSIPDLMFKDFIIMSSLPAMIQTVVLSSLYKTDVEYATVIVSITTILSIITIPVYMVLLSYI